MVTVVSGRGGRRYAGVRAPDVKSGHSRSATGTQKDRFNQRKEKSLLNAIKVWSPTV